MTVALVNEVISCSHRQMAVVYVYLHGCVNTKVHSTQTHPDIWLLPALLFHLLPSMRLCCVFSWKSHSFLKLLGH